MANSAGRRPGGRAACHALPARPVLDSPFSTASRWLVRRTGRVDSARSRSRLRHRALHMLQSTGWIAAHRFLFAGVRCHLLGWPRGLAPDGRPRRTPAGVPIHLSLPTHHLHGTAAPFPRMRPGENLMDDKAEKVALFRYGLIAPLVLEDAAPRRTHAPRPGDRRPPLRHPPFHPPPGLGGHAAGLDAALSPQRTSRPCRPNRGRTAASRAP